MNLRDFVEEIKKVVAEIDNEEVDYAKIRSLMSVLKKLIIKYREKALLSSMPEVMDATHILMEEWSSDKSTNLGQVLKYLLELSIEVQRDEYIDFNVSPRIR